MTLTPVASKRNWNKIWPELCISGRPDHLSASLINNLNHQVFGPPWVAVFDVQGLNGVRVTLGRDTTCTVQVEWTVLETWDELIDHLLLLRGRDSGCVYPVDLLHRMGFFRDEEVLLVRGEIRSALYEAGFEPRRWHRAVWVSCPVWGRGVGDHDPSSWWLWAVQHCWERVQVALQGVDRRALRVLDQVLKNHF